MTQLGLTPRQRDALNIISRTLDERGIAPSLQELADALGFRAKSAAHRLVMSLQERGHITTRAGRARTIALTHLASSAPPQSRSRAGLDAPDDWRLIGVAPMPVHTSVIIHATWPGGFPFVGEGFLDRDGLWRWATGQPVEPKHTPVHWRPLPAPPPRGTA